MYREYVYNFDIPISLKWAKMGNQEELLVRFPIIGKEPDEWFQLLLTGRSFGAEIADSELESRGEQKKGYLG